MNISETSGPIATKFYQMHHWDWGKAALGFGPDRIEFWFPRQLTGKSCEHSSTFIFERIFFILAGNKEIHNISDEFEIQPDRTKDCGVSCP